MAFNTDFIDPRDFLRNSQPQLLENFTQIRDFIAQDHETFSSGDDGKHKQLTFPVKFPVLTTDFTLFASINLTIPDSILSLFGGTSSGSIDFQRNNLDNDDTSTKAIQLPSGIIIKWAFVDAESVIIPGSGPQSRNVFWSTNAKDLPFSTQYWAAVLSETNNGSDARVAAYVTSVASPSRVSYNLFVRDDFNNNFSNGTLLNNRRLIVLAIGV